MLLQKHRFHGYGSLKPVYLRGNNVRGPLVSLKYGTRDPKKPYRVAVVVSKKVHKSAVVRNRIRRRVYERVRLSSTPLPNGIDLVFTVYSEEVATIDTAKLTKIIEELIKKATNS